MQISSTNPVYLLTGGNLGHRETYLANAKEAIEVECGLVAAASPLYETEAWGVQGAPYLNQALTLHTVLSPQALLIKLLAIEKTLGRVRTHRYSARTIDIDILLYHNKVVAEAGLFIPHLQLPHRRFALQCLVHIAPQVLHPVLHQTVQELLDACTDPLWARRVP